MSIEAMAWAKRQRCGGPAPKAVLLVLADYADARSVCWPGQRLISWETELAERTVRGHLAALEEQRLISRTRRNRDDGSRTSDLYQLHLDVEVGDTQRPLPAESAGRDDLPATDDGLPATDDRPTGGSSRVTVREPLEEQESGASAALEGMPEPEPDPAAVRLKEAEVIAKAWWVYYEENFGPIVAKDSGKPFLPLRTMIANALKDYSPGEVKKALFKVGKSVPSGDRFQSALSEVRSGKPVGRPEQRSTTDAIRNVKCDRCQDFHPPGGPCHRLEPSADAHSRAAEARRMMARVGRSVDEDGAEGAEA